MSSYGIFRFEKIKASDMGDFIGRLKHSFREFKNGYKNERTKDNLFDDYSKSWEQVYANYQERIKDVRKRSDSVGLIEVVITSTERPDWTTDDYKDYLEDGLAWLKKEFTEENVVGAVMHLDEKVPHFHAFITPVIEQEVQHRRTDAECKADLPGRKEIRKQLNISHWVDGKKTVSALQDRFYDEVSKKYGFDRGELAEETHRTHTRIRLDKEIERYKDLNKSLEASRIRLDALETRYQENIQELEKRLLDASLERTKAKELKDEKKIIYKSVIDEFFIDEPERKKKRKDWDMERE